MRYFLLISMTVLGCTKTEVPPTPTKPETAAKVAVHGALFSVMHENDRSARVKLASVVPGPHTFAVGALSGLRGEVTIVDDKVWLAYADGDKARVTSTVPPDESAVLLVTAPGARWVSKELTRDTPWLALDTAIAELVKELGLKGPVMLRVDGELRDLRWHVVDGTKLPEGPSSHEEHQKAALVTESAATRGQLVGFFSTEHQGVFTHHDSQTHWHCVLADGSGTGHVDAVSLPKGTEIFFAVE